MPHLRHLKFFSDAHLSELRLSSRLFRPAAFDFAAAPKAENFKQTAHQPLRDFRRRRRRRRRRRLVYEFQGLGFVDLIIGFE